MIKPISVLEYAKREGISRQAAWERIKCNAVKAKKIGRSYVIFIPEKTKNQK